MARETTPDFIICRAVIRGAMRSTVSAEAAELAVNLEGITRAGIGVAAAAKSKELRAPILEVMPNLESDRTYTPSTGEDLILEC